MWDRRGGGEAEKEMVLDSLGFDSMFFNRHFGYSDFFFPPHGAVIP